MQWSEVQKYVCICVYVYACVLIDRDVFGHMGECRVLDHYVGR